MYKRNKSQSKLPVEEKEASQKTTSPSNKPKKQKQPNPNDSFRSAYDKNPQAQIDGYKCLNQANTQIWKSICQWNHDFAKIHEQICGKFLTKNEIILSITQRYEREAMEVFKQWLCKIPNRMIEEISLIDKANENKLSKLEKYLRELESHLQKEKKELYQSSLALPDLFYERTVLPHKQEIKSLSRQMDECKLNVDKIKRFQYHNKLGFQTIQLTSISESPYSFISVEQVKQSFSPFQDDPKDRRI